MLREYTFSQFQSGESLLETPELRVSLQSFRQATERFVKQPYTRAQLHMLCSTATGCKHHQQHKGEPPHKQHAVSFGRADPPPLLTHLLSITRPETQTNPTPAGCTPHLPVCT